MRFEKSDIINRFTTGYETNLPGARAHTLMAPDYRSEIIPASSSKQASVLILLVWDREVCYIPLMKRTVYPGPHSGQISLPGGKPNQSDTSPEETALRETWEEIGISPSDIRVLGKLSPLIIPVTGMQVNPFVGYFTGSQFDPVIDPHEVQYLIMMPLSQLYDKANISYFVEPFRGKERKIPYYSFEKEVIWGATAMILAELSQIIAPATEVTG